MTKFCRWLKSDARQERIRLFCEGGLLAVVLLLIVRHISYEDSVSIPKSTADLSHYQCLSKFGDGKFVNAENFIAREAEDDELHICHVPDDYRKPPEYRFNFDQLKADGKLPPVEFSKALEHFGVTEKQFKDSMVVEGNISPLQHNVLRAKDRGKFKIAVFGEGHSQGIELAKTDCDGPSVCHMWQLVAAWIRNKLDMEVTFINRATGAASAAMFAVCAQSYANLSDVDLVILETATEDTRTMGSLYQFENANKMEASLEFFFRSLLVHGSLSSVPHIISVNILGMSDKLSTMEVAPKLFRYYNLTLLAPYLGKADAIIKNPMVYLKSGGHPNREAHQMYAQFVYLYILKQLDKMRARSLPPKFSVSPTLDPLSGSPFLKSLQGIAANCLPIAMRQKVLVRPQPLPVLWKHRGTVAPKCGPNFNMEHVRTDSPAYFEVPQSYEGLQSVLEVIFKSPELPRFSTTINLGYLEISNYGTDEDADKNIQPVTVTLTSKEFGIEKAAHLHLISGVYHSLVPQPVDTGLTLTPNKTYSLKFENSFKTAANIHGVYVYFT